jgi:maltose/moltooligosaccharide transporter
MGFALQNSNVSRIFQTLALILMTFQFLGCRSMTGLIIQPIIGYFSDRTWTKLGRKPYFLAGAILASAFIPDAKFTCLWIAAGIWIMDINVSMEPFGLSLEIVFLKSNEQWVSQCKAFFHWNKTYFASKLPVILLI